MTKFIYIKDLEGVHTYWGADELLIAKDDIVRVEKTKNKITVVNKNGSDITLHSENEEKINDLWGTFLWELGD